MGASAVQAPQHEPSFEIGTMEAVFHLGRQLRRASIVSRVMDQQGFLCDNLACGREGSRISVVMVCSGMFQIKQRRDVRWPPEDVCH